MRSNLWWIADFYFDHVFVPVMQFVFKRGKPKAANAHNWSFVSGIIAFVLTALTPLILAIIALIGVLV